MRAIVTLTYDLSDVSTEHFSTVKAGSNGLPYYVAYLKLELRLDSMLHFRILLNGEELGNVTATYEE